MVGRNHGGSDTCHEQTTDKGGTGSTASPERQWLVVGVVVLPCAYICSVFCTASCVFLLSTYCMAGWVFRLVAVAWLIMYDNADRVVANKYFAFFIGVVRL